MRGFVVHVYTLLAALTGDEQWDDFAADRLGVDGAPVNSGVIKSHVLQLQVPVSDQRTHDAEARVVDHSSFLVRQRDRVLLQPRYLTN